MLLASLPIKQPHVDPSLFDNEFLMFVTHNKLDLFAQWTINPYYHGIDRMNNRPNDFKFVEDSKPEGDPFIY